MELYLVKRNGALYPATPWDMELFEKIGDGKTVKVVLTCPRNIRFHRKFFSLLHYAYDNWDQETPPGLETKPNMTKNRFRELVTIKAGHSNESYTPLGNLDLEAKSIAFGSMKEDEFQELYKDVLNVIWQYFFPTCTTQEVERASAEYLMNYA